MIRKGFNLVELMAVIAIIAILAGISYPMYTKSRAASRARTIPSACSVEVISAMENFYTNYGRYPDPAGGANVLGFPDNACSNDSFYSFTWTIDDNAQAYRLVIQDGLRSVYGSGSLGADVWIVCSRQGILVNTNSPGEINPTTAEDPCFN
jgi:prepilin-type N-terminal cleavage/methylation domain-containing protein